MSGDVSVGVLAVQGDVREHLKALEAIGVNAVNVRRRSELDSVNGLIIPGGESTTIDKLTRAFDLREPIVQRIRSGMPTYGSCAGLIMLAERVLDSIDGQLTFGGLDITARRNAFGRQIASFEEDLHMPAIGEDTIRAVFIRAPWVEEVGPDVEVLGRVEAGLAEGRVVAVRQGNLLATSFHPEVTGDTRVHELFVDMVKNAS